MNILCFLLTRFSKTLLNENLGRAFALKYAAELFKNCLMSFSSLKRKPKLDQEFEEFH